MRATSSSPLRPSGVRDPRGGAFESPIGNTSAIARPYACAGRRIAVVVETPVSGRSVLAADAAIEALLALLLVTEPVLLGRVVDLPLPTWAIVLAGAALVPAAALLAALARLAPPPARMLLLVAAANLATAVAFTLWVALDGGFDAASAAFVLAVVALLVVLGALEIASARPR